MSWKYVDDLLLKFSKNATLFGKIWILSILLFRLLVLTAFGEHIWSDEQREFTCNTKQPGCENVCFNIFTPVSNVRMWGFQMLAVSVPGAFYFLYVLHVISRSKIVTSQSARRVTSKTDDKRTAAAGACERHKLASQEEPIKGTKKRWKLLSGSVIPTEIKSSRIRCVWKLYFFQIVLRIVIECLFSLLQYEVYFYRWTVPEVFACSQWPCPHTVDCFISRPHEKTVFFRYMFAVSGLSVLLSLAELFHIFWTGMRHSCQTKRNSKNKNSNYLFAKPSKIQNLYVPVMDKFEREEIAEKLSNHNFKRKGGSKAYSSENSSVIADYQENENNNANNSDHHRMSYL